MQTSATRNTLEYRKEIGKAARQLVPHILAEAGGMSSWQDILNGFKTRRPDLSDDALPCQCGNRHPQWEHCVATAMQGLKRARVVEHPARGVWKLATAPPSVPKPPSAPPSPKPMATSLLSLIGEHIQGLRESLARQIGSLSPEEFEQLAAAVLERLGYSDVRRVGGPGDRNVDVAATYRAPSVRFPIRVQVKHRRGGPNIGPSDVAAFRDRAGGADHTLLMVTNVEFTDGGKETASEQGRQVVHLMGGEELIDSMVDKKIGVKERPMGVPDIDEDFWGQF